MSSPVTAAAGMQQVWHLEGFTTDQLRLMSCRNRGASKHLQAALVQRMQARWQQLPC